MSKKRRFKGGEIPTASMADIAFLLLIFFLLTTTVSSDKGLALLLPGEGIHQYTLPGYVDISAKTKIHDAAVLEFDAIMGEPQGIDVNATITIGDFTITIENPTGYINVQ